MKNKKIFVIISLIIAIICLAGCGNKKEENPYGTVIAGLGDDEAYAVLVMDHPYHVLVTSDLLYDAGIEKQAAANCDVYYYEDHEAKKLGTVMSAGTAYPIAFSKDGIYAASGSSVEKYAISKEGTLILEKGIYIKYDENGNESYSCMINGEESDSTKQAYLELSEEYASAQVVHFAYGAADCLNEIMKP